MSITFDPGMLGFQVSVKDVKMETVAGKVLIEVHIYACLSHSAQVLMDREIEPLLG